MNKFFQKDTLAAIILAVLCILFITIPSFSKLSVSNAIYVLLLFFLPGFALLTAASPKMGLIKKILAGIPISLAIVLLLSTSSKYTKIQFENIEILLLTLAGLTILFALIGFARGLNFSKKTRYVICEDCQGYYELEKGESLDDFQACHCGGKLIYAEDNFLSKPKTPERKERKKFFNIKRSPKKPKIASKEYIVCEDCGGYYKLKKEESLDDFEKCHCGGNLQYAKKYFKLANADESPISGKSLKNTLIIIILGLLAVAAVIVAPISNSIIRLILMLPLLFFLPGYSIAKVLFNDLSRFKLIISSILLSTALTFLLSLVFSSFLKVSQTICILALAGLTIILTIVSYIKTPKSAPSTIKHPKLHESETKTLKVKNKESRSLDKNPVFRFYNKKLKFIPSDILIVWLITILCVIFVLVPLLNGTFLKTILGSLLILFVPGYSLIAALFPKKDDLDGIERAALSFGLSIAVTTLIVLTLNYTPFGIRLEPILTSISVFTILMGIAAYIRRSKLPDEEKLNIEFKKYYENWLSSFKAETGTSKILSIALIASILIAISGTAYVIAVPKEGEKFTEFYILGPNGKASDYPLNLTVGQTGNVTVGIVNHEYATVNYKILIKLNNETIDEKNITLNDNEKYEAPFTFSPSHSGEKQELEFLLYKLPDENNTYRSLHLWLNVE